MSPDTGAIYTYEDQQIMDPAFRARLVPIGKREFPRVQAMGIQERKAWAAAKAARREAAKHARKARRKSRA